MLACKQVTCKTALSPSSLPGLDYSLNPYFGCEHACIYCYAPFTLRYSGTEPWGGFVSARVNMPVVLESELRKKKPGVIGLSTVSDPYQPAEEKLKLTRACLETLAPKDFSVCIQTKSALVTRDIDILKDMKSVEAGLTVTTLDDLMAKLLEPGASPPAERIKAIRTLSGAGIDTWAFIGPIIPGAIDTEKMFDLLAALKDAGIKKAMFDRLRLKPGMWPKLEARLADAPALLEQCKAALFMKNDFFNEIKKDAIQTCKMNGLQCEFFY